MPIGGMRMSVTTTWGSASSAPLIKVAVAPAGDIDLEALAQVSRGHRREESA